MQCGTFDVAHFQFPIHFTPPLHLCKATAPFPASVTAHSGGHSYTANSLGGKSGCIIIDMQNITAVCIDSTTNCGNSIQRPALAKPFSNTMNSERTHLSAAALDYLNAVVPHLGLTFDTLFLHFTPQILHLSNRANRVVSLRMPATQQYEQSHCGFLFVWR